MARENAAILGLAGRVALLRADWTGAIAAESFDLVTANPPYVASGEIAGLEPEVRDHEPRLALDGGPDGLDAYRVLAPEILRILRPGGVFAVEIGPSQGARVQGLFRAAGAVGVRTTPDLAARDRVVTGRKGARFLSGPGAPGAQKGLGERRRNRYMRLISAPKNRTKGSWRGTHSGFGAESHRGAGDEIAFAKAYPRT